MALVGTCGFGSLVRLGAGDLRSLIVMIVFGAAAYATLRGMLAPLRIDGLERIAVAVPGSVPGDLPSVLRWLGLCDVRLPLAVAAFLVLTGAVLFDARLRRSPRLLLAGLTLGLGVVLGWWATGVAVDEFAASQRTQSLTFVSPVGRALYAVLTTPAGLLDFGIGSISGVVCGSFASALYDAEFRWEAFDRRLRVATARSASKSDAGRHSGSAKETTGWVNASPSTRTGPFACLISKETWPGLWPAVSKAAMPGGQPARASGPAPPPHLFPG